MDEKEQYRQNAVIYFKYMEAARNGLVPSDLSRIIELRNWLRENFKEDYLDRIF